MHPRRRLRWILVVAALTSAATAPLPVHADWDLYIKDNPADDGSVPSSPPLAASPDIWVRNDGNCSATSSQTPVLGTSTTICARVRNRMTEAIYSIDVHLYWGDSSQSPSWPSGWLSVGSFSIANLPGLSDTVGFVSWSVPSTTASLALLVRADAPGYDPIGSGPDTMLPVDVVENNNNIAQRNLSGAHRIQGRVYEGTVGDLGSPLTAVTVTLYGSSDAPNVGTVIQTTSTNSSGWYGFDVDDSVRPDYYNLRPTAPTGYVAEGARSVSGTVVAADWIQITYPLLGKDLTGNQFWFETEESPPVTVSGHVWEGTAPDTGTPLPGAAVALYCSADPYPQQGTQVATTTSAGNGTYTLTTVQTCDYLHVIESDPGGYSSTGASSPDGTIRTDSWIEHAGPFSPGDTLTHNDFWDQAEATGDMAFMVPVVAHLAGVGAVPWRSDIALTNRTDDAMDILLRYTPAPGETYQHEVTLLGRETVLMEDVVAGLFTSADGRGPLVVGIDSSLPLPAILSRTFAQEEAGNVGQGLPCLWPFEPGTYYITGLLHSAAYRSNVAVSAGNLREVEATLDLLRGAAGEVVSGVRKTVPEGVQAQWPVQKLFSGVHTGEEPMTVRVTTEEYGIPWASVVDNASQDGVTVIGRKPALSWLIPVIARNPGVGTTYWRSDLALFNASALPNRVTLRFLPQNRANDDGGVEAAPISLAAWETTIVADVVGEIFEQSNVKGALYIAAEQPVVAISRAYTSGGLGETYGHAVPAVSPDDVFVTTEATLTGVRTLDGYRTNMGFLTTADAADLVLQLLDGDGSVLAQRQLSMPAHTLRQYALTKLFPGADDPYPAGAVTVSTSAPLMGYISVIDGSSEDPVYSSEPFEPGR